jgi:hypothetical protein
MSGRTLSSASYGHFGSLVLCRRPMRISEIKPRVAWHMCVEQTYWCSTGQDNRTRSNRDCQVVLGTAAAQWLRCCATNRKVTGSIPADVIDVNSFRSHYDPGVGSDSNRNEYQEHFLGGKGGRCVRLTTLPPPCAVVMKSGNLNFLEPSGALKDCNGTALPLSRSRCHARDWIFRVVTNECRYNGVA